LKYRKLNQVRKTRTSNCLRNILHPIIGLAKFQIPAYICLFGTALKIKYYFEFITTWNNLHTDTYTQTQIHTHTLINSSIKAA